MIKGYFVIFFVILFFSCKKKEAEQTNVPSGQPAVTYSKVNGLFVTMKELDLVNDTIKFIAGFNRATVYDSLTSIDSLFAHKGSDVGILSGNNIVFKKYVNANYQPFGYFYDDTINNVITIPQNWMIGGSSNFPATSFVSNIPFPTYSGFLNLPDTIYNNKNNVINVTNYFGADNIEIQIMGNSASSNGKSLPIGATSVTFTPIDLNSFFGSNNDPVKIRIDFTKVGYVSSGGKIYRMETGIYFWSDEIYFKD